MTPIRADPEALRLLCACLDDRKPRDSLDPTEK